MTMFNKLRLLIAGFGLGTILTGTVALWEVIPVQYKVFFVIALGFILYICLSLTTIYGEHTHDKENYLNARPIE